MSELPAIFVDKEAIGPKMSACTDMQQMFVIAYTTFGPRRIGDAAIAAGYSPKNAAQQGYNLMRIPKIKEALAEEAGHRLASGVLIAANVLMEIAEDPTHKDRLKAAKLLLENARIITPPDQVIEVKHTVNEKEQIQKIVAMAGRLGIDPKELLGQYGVVIDAEFEDVTEARPDPIRSEGQAALPAPDDWTIYPEDEGEPG